MKMIVGEKVVTKVIVKIVKTEVVPETVNVEPVRSIETLRGLFELGWRSFWHVYDCSKKARRIVVKDVPFFDDRYHGWWMRFKPLHKNGMKNYENQS
jgi:hypothetical protein